MFINKRYFQGFSFNRNHEIDETITKVGEILRHLECFPQCRWFQDCDINCCLYQCHECYVNALIVGVLQDCYNRLKAIQTTDKE